MSQAADSLQPENPPQSIVHVPELLDLEASGERTESFPVDCTDLLDQDASRVILDRDLGSKRGWSGARRRGRDDDHRSRQQLVGLDDNSESVAVLLPADTLGQSQAVDVTAAHAATP